MTYSASTACHVCAGSMDLGRTSQGIGNPSIAPPPRRSNSDTCPSAYAGTRCGLTVTQEDILLRLRNRRIEQFRIQTRRFRFCRQRLA